MTTRLLAFLLAMSLFFVACAEGPSDKPAADSHSHVDSAAPAQAPKIERAVCVVQSVADSGVTGVLTFTRQGDKIALTGSISGLTPGKHGFHIHEYGDVTSLGTDGLSTGGHFNPAGTPHGRPDDEHRHVGDLGNIEADENGVANIEIADSMLQFDGAHSIIGRSVVVHADEDKFTQPVGDAGGRVGIGVIGIARRNSPRWSGSCRKNLLRVKNPTAT